MASQAKERLAAVGKHLEGGGSLPPVTKIAGASAGPRLRGKVAIITGANSVLGIGRASAFQFAENGVKALYICDFDDSNLATHARDIAALYPSVELHTRQFDASDESAVKEVVAHALATYGRLDVFFANAGITGGSVHFTQTTKEDFARVLEVNTTAVFLAAKHAAPAMMKTSGQKPKSGGSIIGTASVAGLRSNAGATAYSASKAGVVSIAQTCAYQLVGTNVRVNALCPGLIETGMTAPTFDAARARGTQGKIGQLNPTRRAGHADEIARAALFLASDEASYVNGQAWAVDGGLSAGHPFVPGKLA